VVDHAIDVLVELKSPDKDGDRVSRLDGDGEAVMMSVALLLQGQNIGSEILLVAWEEDEVELEVAHLDAGAERLEVVWILRRDMSKDMAKERIKLDASDLDDTVCPL
jgi:hypothetical protein